MPSKKIAVAVLYGGKSAEHEVSLRSAKTIVDALDKKKYRPVLVGIDKAGRWLLQEHRPGQALKIDTAGERVALEPGGGGRLVSLSVPGRRLKIDVVFPILHGPMGEDGTVQGLLKLAEVPFVGPGVLGSAAGMDKDVMKRLFREAGLPIGKFLTLRRGEKLSFAAAAQKLGSPVFVKPANLGSSVGVGKAKNRQEFDRAVAEAFRYDQKILVEEFIDGREVECAVLGNARPRASVVGEIVPHAEFYSYEAKYLDPDGAALVIPAKLPSAVAKRVQAVALKAYVALCCEGLSRVDCFLKKNGQVLVNEINTLPGFTSASMYPMLWQASGLETGQLVEELIRLAFERYEAERRLASSY